MRRLLLATAALLLGSTALAADLAVFADHAHVGDGRVIEDAVVLVTGDHIDAIGPAARLHVPDGVERRHVSHLLPGLVASSVVPGEPQDAPSVDPERLAVDLAIVRDAPEWLRRGVTSLVVSPGTTRLVPGRSGVLRLDASGARVHLGRGAPAAVLAPSAFNPPLLFEPGLRVNVDNPLAPAQPQRPSTPMAAVAGLRELLVQARHESSAAWADVLGAPPMPLRVRADAEADVRRAADLAREHGFELVIEGGAEAWKLAGELGALRATVLLESAAPGRPLPWSRMLDARPDAAATLARAGVRVGLAARRWEDRDPLLLAAAAVRHGLAPEDALAAVTSIAARAAGARDLGLLAPGAAADLVGFDAPPLLAAGPVLVVARGAVVELEDAADQDDDEPPPLVLRAGLLMSAGRSVEKPSIVLRAGRIVSVLPSSSVPAGARLMDFGPDAVVVPGFIDAFSRTGLEPGPPAGGGSRLRAVDALEPGHDTLARALHAGVTVALSAPSSRGPVLGSAAVVDLSAPERPPLRDADRPDEELPQDGRPQLDVITADAGLVFWLDDGPLDASPAAPRLKALREVVSKAKAYHEKWVQSEKKPEERKARRGAAAPKPPEKPEKDPILEPYRPLFTGKARAWLRSGREDTMIAGIDALKGAGMQPVLVGGEEADLVAGELAQRGVIVVLGPDPTRRSGGETISVAERLRARGVPVALGSFVPGAAESLPLAAARLVRLGLAPDDALLALTATAAGSCGLEGAGKVEPGARGDLVVFDGDPFEPSSRVLAVVARGRVAFERVADQASR